MTGPAEVVVNNFTQTRRERVLQHCVVVGSRILRYRPDTLHRQVSSAAAVGTNVSPTPNSVSSHRQATQGAGEQPATQTRSAEVRMPISHDRVFIICTTGRGVRS